MTTARKQISAGHYDAKANEGLERPCGPGHLDGGQAGGDPDYIDEWKKPVLVGGDTPTSDGYMQFHGVDVGKGGIHLWINRKAKYMDQLNGMIAKRRRRPRKGCR